MALADLKLLQGDVFYVDEEAGLLRDLPRGVFFFGRENWFPIAALERFLADPASPLLAFFGPPGTGKTHLLDLLEKRFGVRYPRASVLRWNAAEFGQEFAAALDQGKYGQFRRRWRRADLLILDDLQFLSQYPAAQTELVAVLQAAWRGHPRVALASRIRPWHIPDLDPRIGQILEGGLTAPLFLPEFPVRRALLIVAFAERALSLTQAAAEYLARELPVSAREITGLAQQARHQFEHTVVDYPLAVEILRKSGRQPGVKMELIARATARYFRIPLTRLRGPGRHRNEVLARNIAMYLSQRLGKKTLNEIGRYFGGRDHTTVSHGCRKIEALAGRDFAIQEALLIIQELVEQQMRV